MEETGIPTGLLSIAIPSLIALIASVIGYLLLRRSQAEKNRIDLELGSDANDTNSFKTVTDQLFRLNDDLRGDIEKLRVEVSTLMVEVASYKAQIGQLTEDLEETDQKLRSQLSITRQLANYIKRLIASWPAGAGPVPNPDPPIDWSLHLR